VVCGAYAEQIPFKVVPLDYSGVVCTDAAPCYESLSTHEALYFLLAGQLLYIHIPNQIFQKKVSEVTSTSNESFTFFSY
jgi:hypothetical protein